MVTLRIPGRAVVPIVVLLAVLLAAPSSRAQSTTTWFGSVGDWSVAANWSNGEPTATSTAVLTFAGTVNVTQPGEVCRSLWLGMTGGIVSAVITGGTLSVSDSLRVGAVGSGSVQHQSGTVSAGKVILGSPGQSGSYLHFAGSLTTARLECGTRAINSSGTYSSSVQSPVCTITDSLYIGPSGSYVCGAGTLTVGSGGNGGVLVDRGAFQVINTPVMNVAGFKMTAGATFTRTIIFGSNSTLVSSGPVVLDGQLLVLDLSTPDGSYELIRGNPLTGTFDITSLPPTGNWSWRIEGNSLWVTRGTVPVEPTTWSRVKAGIGR